MPNCVSCTDGTRGDDQELSGLGADAPGVPRRTAEPIPDRLRFAAVPLTLRVRSFAGRHEKIAADCTCCFRSGPRSESSWRTRT